MKKSETPVNFLELVQCLEETPRKLSGLVDKLSDEELRRKGSDEEFSVLENVCHLRDLEAEVYSPRINRILNETNPFLADFDGARVAIERNYNGERLKAALEAFVLSRTENARILAGLTAEQREREGILEGVGKVRLKRLAEMMREHDEGHLGDLCVLRQRLLSRSATQES